VIVRITDHVLCVGPITKRIHSINAQREHYISLSILLIKDGNINNASLDENKTSERNVKINFEKTLWMA
jgi:hypothetical protein